MPSYFPFVRGLSNRPMLDENRPQIPTISGKSSLERACLELAILAALWDGRFMGSRSCDAWKRFRSRDFRGTVYPLLSRLSWI